MKEEMSGCPKYVNMSVHWGVVFCKNNRKGGKLRGVAGETVVL
jgi:hypothetical protein